MKKLISLFVLYLTFIGGNYALYLSVFEIRVAHHLILSAVLAVWLCWRGLPQTPFLWPLGGLFCVVIASAALSPIDPRMALENVWYWLNHILLFLLLIDLIRAGYLKTMLGAVFTGALILIAGGLVEFALEPGQRVASLFYLVNTTGTYAAALVVPALAMLKGKQRAALVIGLIALVILNSSRGAILALAVSLLIFGLLQSILNLKKFAVLVLVGALAVGAISLQPGRVHGDQYRADLWRSALEMSADYPALGVGPGLFGLAYRNYRTQPYDYAAGAHNVILNTFAELGGAGALAGGVLLLTFALCYPINPSKGQKAAAAALGGIGAALLFDGFPGTNFSLLAMLLAAYVVSSTYPEKANLIKPLRLAALGLVLVYAVWLVRLDTAQFYYERSLRENNPFDARTATALDPDLRLYWLNAERFFGREWLNQPVHRDQFAAVSYSRRWR